MLSLRELQTGFASALFNPGPNPGTPGIRANGVSPGARLGFYRTNVFENYRKALSSTYPAVEKLVGVAFFARLAEEYSRRYPSMSGNVGQHAEQFAEFLRRHACARELPYLSDVARLELCIEDSFNEADTTALVVDRLAAAGDRCERLRFLLAPSCRLMSSLYPVNRIWSICQNESTAGAQVNLDQGGVDLLVHRPNFEVFVEALAPGEFAMLMALATGYVFGDAFEYALGVDATFDPAVFLQRHVLSGVLTDFVLPAEAYAP